MAEYIEREELNNGEKIVFNAIVEFFNKNKFPPTVRELCKLTGYKSTCTVQNKLKSLELKGYIETNAREKRTLRIKEPTADVVAVVRCKNCTHYKDEWCEILRAESPIAEGFCCYGERRCE